MKLNSKVTWGLAWTGLAVVLAVPSADYLTGRLGVGGGNAAVLTSDIEPVKTASTGVTTIKTENGVTIVPAGVQPADQVSKVLSSGKKLPDYITDDAAPAPAAAATPPVKTTIPMNIELPKETQVASVPPSAIVAPTPFPSWARAKAIAAPAPAVTTTPAATAKPTLAVKPVAPAKTTAPIVAAEPLVIVDETRTGSLNNAPAVPVPPSSIVDDSENWDTDNLREYLERRGILEGGSTTRSRATVTERQTTYDPNGFYLNEGPNADRETRRRRIEQMLLESEDEPTGFTLF